MEVTTLFTYTELKRSLAERLGRETIPTSTLSRWMRHLKYEKGKPGRKRWWEEEDLFALYCLGERLHIGYTVEDAKDYAHEQVKNWRKYKNGTQH